MEKMSHQREVHVYMVCKNKKKQGFKASFVEPHAGSLWECFPLGLQRIRSEMTIGPSDHTLRVILCLHIIIRTEWELEI